MNLFNLSSAQRMILFSEVNNPNNDSFYLNIRKDYDLKDFDYVKSAITAICQCYLNLQIKYDENGDFKQYYAEGKDVNVETFEVNDENIDEFIKEYLNQPFGDIFDSPLYRWAVLKTDSSTVLVGVVQVVRRVLSLGLTAAEARALDTLGIAKRRLDLDDLGAHVGQHTHGGGAGNVGAELDDLDTSKGAVPIQMLGSRH